jgi:hypothetical protein
MLKITPVWIMNAVRMRIAQLPKNVLIICARIIIMNVIKMRIAVRTKCVLTINALTGIALQNLARIMTIAHLIIATPALLVAEMMTYFLVVVMRDARYLWAKMKAIALQIAIIPINFSIVKMTWIVYLVAHIICGGNALIKIILVGMFRVFSILVIVIVHMKAPLGVK